MTHRPASSAPEASPRPAPGRDARLAALERQVGRLQARLADLERTSGRLASARLAVFGSGVVVVFGASFLDRPWIVAAALVGSASAFVALVRRHRRIDRAAARCGAWVAIKSGHIARSRLAWASLPAPADFEPRPTHPFEGDLDIVGERSLHRLLDVAVSRQGSARLRDWLTDPAPDTARIAARQAAVRELVTRARWRDKLALNTRLAAAEPGRWDVERLRQWLAAAPVGSGRGRWIGVLAALGAVNVALFIALTAHRPNAGIVLLVTIPVYLVLYARQMLGTRDPFHEALELESAVLRLIRAFGHLERDAYAGAPNLRAQCEPFLDPTTRPSTHLARVERTLALAGIRGNPALWLILNAVCPWDLFVIDRLDRCRGLLARDAPLWLDAWFELEALASLATLAYLHPDHAFPTIGASPEGPACVFDARGLGHPFLPPEKKVRNDFAFRALGEVAVVTGSNMSGKSTFLKAIGVNLALAYAGGPVDALALHAAPFRLFTCIRVTDSVTDGISYFYAEVKRLRALLAAIEGDVPLPVLFLIDEIFRGTNNRERLVGSRAFVRALARGRGVGLVATHDLELVSLADEIPTVANHHFRDDVSGGRMTFDYTLRPGPCPTTNALLIMRLEGLPE